MHSLQFKLKFTDLTGDGGDQVTMMPDSIEENAEIFIVQKPNQLKSGEIQTYEYRYQAMESNIGMVNFRAHVWPDNFVELAVSKGHTKAFIGWFEGWTDNYGVEDVIEKMVQNIILDSKIKKSNLKRIAEEELLKYNPIL